MQTLDGHSISFTNARNHCVLRLRGLYSTFARGEVPFNSDYPIAASGLSKLF